MHDYAHRKELYFMDEIKATVKVETSDMFCFLMHYSYASVAGIISLLFSIGSIALFFYMWGELAPAYLLILAVLGLLFTVINPVMLYKRAKKQVMTSPAFKESVHYVFSENGIHMDMGKEMAELKWTDIYKVRRVCGRYLLYFNHIRANVVPVSALDGGVDASKKLDIMIKKSRR